MSDALSQEVHRAMDLGVHVILAHEMPSEVGGQEARFGVEFGAFFYNGDAGTTPDSLLRRKIYSEIALPLRGGAWRDTSMTLLAGSFGMQPKDGTAYGQDEGSGVGYVTNTTSGLGVPSVSPE